MHRLPSVETILGVFEDLVDVFDTMTYYVTVHSMIDGKGYRLECQHKPHCKIIFRRSVTPVLHYVTPPIFYAGQFP